MQCESPTPVLHCDPSPAVLPSNFPDPFTATPQHQQPFQLKPSVFPVFSQTLPRSLSTTHNPPNHLNNPTESAQASVTFVSNFDQNPIPDAALVDRNQAQAVPDNCDDPFVLELIGEFNSADLAAIDILLNAEIEDTCKMEQY